jgi:2-methylisocitrate lyase-like PEP mutase family enzyme
MKAENVNVAEQQQLEKIAAFHRLHKPGNPVILYNVWDAGSAKAVAKSGARAIATSSWAVAKSRGFDDGEQIPFELAIQNLRQLR